MPDFCLEGPIDTKLDSRRRSSHIRRHPRNNNNTTAAATALQLTYPPPAKCMQKLFTCKISVCPSSSVLPPACRKPYYHPPACSTIAMVLCMSMPLALYGTLAVLGDPERRRGRRAKKGLHEAFRQPCRRSALVQAADTHHSSLESHIDTALQKSGQGHVRASVALSGLNRHHLMSAVVAAAEDWAELLLRGVCSLPKTGDACLSVFPCSMPLLSACSCMAVAAAGIRPPLLFGWVSSTSLH